MVGKIEVGDQEVKAYQLKRGLRRNMALVGQEPVIFDMSILDNILWGSDRENVTLEDVERVAALANIHEFVSQLPEGKESKRVALAIILSELLGYNTRVGDKGSQLSGGQKQRIAIVWKREFTCIVANFPI